MSTARAHLAPAVTPSLLLVLALAPGRAAPSPAPPAHEAQCRAALELAYDGSTGTALARLSELNAARPDGLLCAYTELLALVWDIEQAPFSAVRDKDFHRRADRLVAQATARLARDPGDARALLARGGAWGLRSRLHLYRVQKGDAARTAVKMRADLLDVPRDHALHGEALFGIGLYDYYADILPRLFKLLRFFARIPGGDRERGLAAIESAEERAVLHATEVRAQLYDIYAFYEERHDDALARLLALRRRYPGAPLWGLRLAEHQRERLGLYAESAATARELLAAAEAGRRNHAPIVGLMARVALGEALLADLRPGRARAALLPAREGSDLAPWIAPRARLALGRSLELEGDREGAEVHYHIAAASRERYWADAARDALGGRLPREQVRAFAPLAEARRAHEEGRLSESAAAYRRALEAWPDSQEARLRLAEADLAAGRPEAARSAIEGLAGEKYPQPPWVRPWTRLLLARLHDLRGEREAALRLYNEVYQQPFGSALVREQAAAGREHPWRLPDGAARRPRPANHSR